MQIYRSKFFRFCAVVQIYSLIASCVFVSPCWASSNDLSFNDLAKLSSLETVIYGSSYKSMPSERRINALERVLLGKVQKGPLPARLDNLVSIVKGEHNNLLSPPIAPMMDRSETGGIAATPTGAPPIAPQATNDSPASEGMPPTAGEDRVKTMLQNAMQLYSAGQINQAETVFKNVLALDSRNSDANFNLGAIAEGKSDWKTALQYYQAALRGRPDDKEIANAVQSMKDKLKYGQPVNSSPNPNQFVQNSTNTLSSQQLNILKQKVDEAATAYQKGNYDAAIAILKSVAAQAPQQADVQYALGQALRAKGQLPDARAALAQAVALAPSNPQYKSALADIDQQISATVANRAGEAFANQSPSAPAGQITPFADAEGDNGQQMGWQPANQGVYGGGSSYVSPGYISGYTPGYTSSYMPGYAYHSYYPFGMSTGSAAMTAGLAGLALGSMFGLMMSHHHHHYY